MLYNLSINYKIYSIGLKVKYNGIYSKKTYYRNLNRIDKSSKYKLLFINATFKIEVLDQVVAFYSYNTSNNINVKLLIFFILTSLIIDLSKGVYTLIDFDIKRDKGIKVHFVGIGGISMSGLADTLLYNGYSVSGSDVHNSKIVERLIGKGAKISIGHDENNIIGADLIVYTAAVKWDNPELIKAKELNLPIVDRAEFLGQIMKQYKYSIAVSGAHGKTTTTSLLSIILKNADLDPTIMVGGEVDALGGNVRNGKSQYFVAEACEYFESFLRLYPYIGIILNIDADHLDYYKDIAHIKTAFKKFVLLIPNNGYLVVCSDDENSMEISKNAKCNIITFGLSVDADWTARNIEYDDRGCAWFDTFHLGKLFGSFKLNIPGRHNIYNALASLASAEIFNIDKNIISQSLLEFHGTRRRFEKKGEINGAIVIDDYAHHPTEVMATLSAAKNYPHKKLWCVFQPHTYTRTLKLLGEFSHAFGDADELIITDIYAAREKDTGEINSIILTQKIKDDGVNVKYISSFENIVEYLKGSISPGDMVITMGAGDVYIVGEMLLK